MAHSSAVEPPDQFLKVFKVLLPLLSSFFYLVDSFVWNATGKKSYTGWTATIFVVFYYFVYDSGIDRKVHSWFHVLYIVTVTSFMIAGDIALFAYHPNARTTGYLLSAGVDLLYGILLCRQRNHDYKMKFDIDVIFLLIARTEFIFAIFIGVFQVINSEFSTSRNIAYFLIFEVFKEKHFYYDLTSNGRACFWSYCLFFIASNILEWAHLVSTVHYFSLDVALAFCESTAGLLLVGLISEQFMVPKLTSNSNSSGNSSNNQRRKSTQRNGDVGHVDLEDPLLNK